MSTIEPRSRREEQLRAARRGPTLRAQVVVVALGALCAGIMAGSGPRVAEPVWLIGVLVPLPLLFLGLLGSSAWRLHSVVSGRARTLVGPVEYLACTSCVAGVVLVSTGAGETVRYAGFGLVSFAAVMAMLMLVSVVVRRSRARASLAVRARGVRTVGVVTDNGLAEFPDTPNPKLATIIVRFEDNHGAARWLTPTAYQVPAQPIDVGDEVDVWFDPNDPGDVSSIIAEKDNGTSRLVIPRDSVRS